MELDPFQIRAIQALDANENVLITAKTGSGKTLIGEYQITKSLEAGKRVFYTTPIKSLSNQKFHDLKKIHGNKVGILTGDIKFAPQSDVVIMTTEILRNALLGGVSDLSLDNLGAVVFDEVHYINDVARGHIWEECLVLLSPDVRLVLLSATLDSPEPFVEWLTDLKRVACRLISTQFRAVPLFYQTESGESMADYATWSRKYWADFKKKIHHTERVQSREEGQVIEKDVRIGSFIDRMNKLLKRIDIPALFFVFSRRRCEEYASKVDHDFLTSSESADVRHIVQFHLHHYTYLETMQSYYTLFALLQKGIAFHHSGMVPILKEIVEILFGRGLVKVLFATETFAVGINMPTKSVVFTSFRKESGSEAGNRLLTPAEFNQMAGRAGRRGKDTQGIVIYLPSSDPEDPMLVEKMMNGKSARVESQLQYNYEYILAEMASGKYIGRDSYKARQTERQLEELVQESCEKIEKHENLLALLGSYRVECEEKDLYKERIKNVFNAERRQAQRDLAKWENKHMGPRWVLAWDRYQECKMLKEQIQMTERFIEAHEQTRLYDTPFKFLETFGYIEKNKLTIKGRLASVVHEGNPILMTELYLNYKSYLDESQIVQMLSCFLECPDSEWSQRPSWNFVESMEKASSESPEYWTTTTYWQDIVKEWIDGGPAPEGVEPGTFVRAMLQLANLVREWVAMATLTQNVEMIETMKDTERKIVRDVVVPDSLYLRM